MRIALEIPLLFSDFLKHGKAFSKSSYSGYFNHIVTNSKEAQAGDLFFSLTKDKDSAEIHISEAHKNQYCNEQEYKMCE